MPSLVPKTFKIAENCVFMAKSTALVMLIKLYIYTIILLLPVAYNCTELIYPFYGSSKGIKRSNKLSLVTSKHLSIAAAVFFFHF